MKTWREFIRNLCIAPFPIAKIISDKQGKKVIYQRNFRKMFVNTR
jgi:hypothetical protein